jgi:hypothetical protein
MRGVFGKHLIRCLDQDVRVLRLEHEVRIELFHDVLKARDGRAGFVPPRAAANNVGKIDTPSVLAVVGQLVASAVG